MKKIRVIGLNKISKLFNIFIFYFSDYGMAKTIGSIECEREPSGSRGKI